MALTGRALLILGLAVAVFGACASLYGARTGRREWVECGRRSIYTLAGLMTLAFVILGLLALATGLALLPARRLHPTRSASVAQPTPTGGSDVA